MMLRVAVSILLLPPTPLLAQSPDGLLFSFFRGNGEDGLYLATSPDGLRWSALNQNRPILQPSVGENKLMRDPSIARGADGLYRMVWTTSWEGRTIGYATSKDLKNWSPQRAIEVFPKETEVINCWAPEIFYDEASKDFIVVWASTIRGLFPTTQGQAGKNYNHRLYSFRTKDFSRIGKAELFYDPGFTVIDGAIFRDGKRYAMVVKNETLNPPAKNLFLTYSASLKGRWTTPSENISGKDWAEGASPIRIGDSWFIYFDKYRDHKYGAIRSKDLKSWEDITEHIDMPKGARHGTAFRAPLSVIEGLR